MRIYLTDVDEYDEISIFSRNGIEGNAENWVSAIVTLKAHTR